MPADDGKRAPQDGASTPIKNAIISPGAIKIKGFLILFIASYLTWAYIRPKRNVDAETLITAIQQHVLKELPAYKEDTIRQLKASAPLHAKELMERVIGAIPRWRQSTENDIKTTFESASEDVQGEMNRVIASLAKEEQKKLESQAAGADKDALLKKNLVARLGSVSKLMLEDAQRHYSKDLTRLRNELTRLRDNKGLKPKEKFERQALACWVKLMKLKLEKIKTEG